jgi:membrane-bound lytic murein transglycosylase F
MVKNITFCKAPWYALRNWLLLGGILLPQMACRPAGASDHSSQANLMHLDFWGKAPVEEPVGYDLDEIRERGRLVAIVDNSSTSYFIYRGQPMGYEYELLTRLAHDLDVDLEIVITPDIQEAVRKLNAGEGDLIAHNLTVTRERQQEIAFTHHHNEVRQVLVQRKPIGWQKLKKHELEAALLRNPLELAEQTVHLRNHSAYVGRMRHLAEEIGSKINLKLEDESTETLIRMVAEGKIDYTVADEDVARLNAAYFANIDVSTPVSFSQKIAWAVRKNAPELLNAVNDWITRMRSETDYYVIYNKYFKNRTNMRQLASSNYASINGSDISPYDELLKKEASRLGWDWRLLASVVYQESRFDPQAKAWTGAQGLMQLMPETAEVFGAENPLNPAQSIAAGVNYLQWLDKYWADEVPDAEERLKFVLASYNVGQGHVRDAIRLARKYGRNPQLWDEHVEYYLEQKANPEVYKDEAARLGYCRGSEPVKYVKSILRRSKRYQQLFPEPVPEQEPVLAYAGR